MPNIRSYQVTSKISVRGFIVPLEFVTNCSLAKIETILGFRKGRLQEGAVFAQLHRTPLPEDLDYLGDTRTAGHHWEPKREKVQKTGVAGSTQMAINSASYAYLRAGSRLIKVMPIKNFDPQLSDDENFPPGQGAMQFKLKKLVPATVIAIVDDYPAGVFK